MTVSVFSILYKEAVEVLAINYKECPMLLPRNAIYKPLHFSFYLLYCLSYKKEPAYEKITIACGVVHRGNRPFRR